MGSTKREQATRILMMALGLAAGIAFAGAQEPASTPEAADAAPAAVVRTPPEAPVTPPKVVCAGNEMTISANNSTLSSVLAEVHRCMGTRIDIPSAAGDKRMFDKIGPGPASQVLDELLSNTGYNYVMGATPGDEEKIESIVLLARNSDAAAAPAVVEDSRAGSTSRRAFMQMHQASIPHPMTDEDNAAAAQISPTEPAPSEAPKPADGQPAATPTTPGAPATDPSQKPADATPAPQPDTPATPASTTNYSTHPSTTEEQIVNMQQMFELRKQMNQQTNQAPPNSTPQP